MVVESEESMLVSCLGQGGLKSGANVCTNSCFGAPWAGATGSSVPGTNVSPRISWIQGTFSALKLT